MIEIRVLTADDWRLWRELRLQALAEAPYAFGSTLAEWQDEGDREERWRSRLDLRGSHNVVAHLDGRPAGMASGIPSDADAVELISMWVAPAGRGVGVGDALVGEISSWAAVNGAARLLLAVVATNARAIAFYRRLGFEEIGPLPRASEDDPLEQAMERSLGG